MKTDRNITHIELKKWIDENVKFTLIDTLPVNSYESHHIPTAHNADVRDGHFVSQVVAIAYDKSKPVVLYCMSPNCTLSPLAAQKLTKAGYTDVFTYQDGLAGWQDAGFAFEGTDAPEKVSMTCDCKQCGCD